MLTYLSLARADEEMDAALRTRMMAVESLLNAPGDDAIDRFVQSHVSDAFRKTLGEQGVRDRLTEFRAACNAKDDIMLAPLGEDGVRMTFSGNRGDHALSIHVEHDAPYKIRTLELASGDNAQSSTRHEPAHPLTWDALATRLSAEAARGFAGAVLVMRHGEVVLHEGYGKANHERHIDNTRETVFAIGSAPIDFTIAGILLLEQQAKLTLTDPISKYFPDVPADKRDITLEQLMTGQSGLHNFHDIPSDRDPDHAWIDRDEAMRRIFANALRFKPGTDRAHSHSAFGVLAAIIEIVSGQSYQQFTRDNFFKPLGMKDTGFHGDPIPTANLAVGYGDRSDGKINAPPYWGKTSWLVMGSGGQVSTVRDMSRWIAAVCNGRVLNEENTQRLLDTCQGLLNGGNAYGFEFYCNYSRSNHFVMMSNAVKLSSRQPVEQLARDIGNLVMAEDAPPFTLGVMFEVGETSLTINQVAPGSAAERDGLKSGDTITGINGTAFEDRPLDQLKPYLVSGKAIPFDVERGGERKRIVVKPNRR